MIRKPNCSAVHRTQTHQIFQSNDPWLRQKVRQGLIVWRLCRGGAGAIGGGGVGARGGGAMLEEEGEEEEVKVEEEEERSLSFSAGV